MRRLRSVGARELMVLGTASQVPTRTRAHQAAVLRWDARTVLFDPGEGTQRQLTLAGVAAGRIGRICITHLHGDHCLGLPGVLQRIASTAGRHPSTSTYPASGQPYIDRLRHASSRPRARLCGSTLCRQDGVVDIWPGLTLSARALDHRVPAYGWRIEGADGRRMLPERLAELGLAGPDVGRLARTGEVSSAVDGPHRGGHRGPPAARSSPSSWTPAAAPRRSSFAATRTWPSASPPTCHRGPPRRAVRPPDRARRGRHRGRGGRPSPRPHPLLRPAHRRAGIRRGGESTGRRRHRRAGP